MFNEINGIRWDEFEIYSFSLVTACRERERMEWDDEEGVGSDLVVWVIIVLFVGTRVCLLLVFQFFFFNQVVWYIFVFIDKINDIHLFKLIKYIVQIQI